VAPRNPCDSPSINLESSPEARPGKIRALESSGLDVPIGTLCSCVKKVAEDVFGLFVGKILEEPRESLAYDERTIGLWPTRVP